MKKYSIGYVVQAAVWGAAAGAATGFALGLLFAPFEGEKMRRSVSYRLEQWGGTFWDMTDRLSGTGMPATERRSSKAVVADAEERAQRIREDIDAILGQMKERETSSSP